MGVQTVEVERKELKILRTWFCLICAALFSLCTVVFGICKP